MTYLYAILAVLVTGFVCLRIIRRMTRARALAERKSRREAIEARRQARLEKRERANRHQVLSREKLHVPTPWGWAGQPRKRTPVDSPSAEQRRNRSIRALLEDRYAPVHTETPRPLEYRKVKPPRLRDPSEPHDQMDNFGTGAADRIQNQLRPRATLNGNAKDERGREPRDLKLPWGW